MVERFGQVAHLVAPGQRRGQDGESAVSQQQRSRFQRRQDVVRQPPALQPLPDAFGQRGVVVARQQHPRAVIVAHGFHHAPQGVIADGIGLEYVAGNQHSIHGALAGQGGDAGNRLQALAAQQYAGIPRDLPERLAQLPIGRVQDTHGHRSTPLFLPAETVAGRTRRLQRHPACRRQVRGGLGPFRAAPGGGPASRHA